MIYFLNHVINEETPLYGDSGSISLKQVKSMSCGDSSNNTEINIPAHAGTHIDAPYHFDPDGKSLDNFLPELWLCESPWLIDYKVSKNQIIYLDDLIDSLINIPLSTDILLLRTGFENYRSKENISDYIFNGPGISPDLGIWLRKNRKLKMIGFDFISLTSYQNRELGRDAHRSFLANRENIEQNQLNDPILIIEDMRLSVIDAPLKKVTVAPLLYNKADGAPVTVLAEV